LPLILNSEYAQYSYTATVLSCILLFTCVAYLGQIPQNMLGLRLSWQWLWRVLSSGCVTISCRCIPMFQRNILPPSSESKSRASCLFGVLFSTEDGSSTSLWNVSKLLLFYTVSHPRRYESPLKFVAILHVVSQYFTPSFKYREQNTSVLHSLFAFHFQ
jgi:hypothetical protein